MISRKTILVLNNLIFYLIIYKHTIKYYFINIFPKIKIGEIMFLRGLVKKVY